jgi:hypothetical protein
MAKATAADVVGREPLWVEPAADGMAPLDTTGGSTLREPWFAAVIIHLDPPETYPSGM